jgi:hypothetical protein
MDIRTAIKLAIGLFVLAVLFTLAEVSHYIGKKRNARRYYWDKESVKR